MSNRSGFRLGLVSGIISVLLILGSLGSSCLGGSPGTRTPTNLANDPDEIENRLRATIAIVDPETERIFCSGFFVSGRQIISAGHCFESSVPFVLPDGQVMQIPDGSDPTGQVVSFITYDDLDMITNRFLHAPQQATIVYFDRNSDTVILELNSPAQDSRYSFELSEARPRVGSQAYGIGHPLRLAWSFETGIVSRVIRNPENGSIILLQASVPVAGGNSGGPLIDSAGSVIGMALAYVNRLPHLSIFISADQIRFHMRRLLVQRLITAYEETQQRDRQRTPAISPPSSPD